jgi:hypothetical protein
LEVEQEQVNDTSDAAGNPAFVPNAANHIFQNIEISQTYPKGLGFRVGLGYRIHRIVKG